MATLLQPGVLPDPLHRNCFHARIDESQRDPFSGGYGGGPARRRGPHGGNVTLGESEQRQGLGLLPGVDLELASSLHVRRG